MRYLLALPLAAMVLGAACAPIGRVAAGPNDGSVAGSAGMTSALPKAAAAASLSDFEGDWAYANDCEFGHYANLSIERKGSAVSGQWSDGTRVRGSDGALRGEIQGSRLVIERCDTGNERGGEPHCPTFAGSHDFFEREGTHLVWYQHYGAEVTRYLVLERSPLRGPRDQGCEEGQ